MNNITRKRAWKQDVKTNRAKRIFLTWYKDKIEESKTKRQGFMGIFDAAMKAQEKLRAEL